MRSIYFDTSIPKVLLTLGLKRIWADAVFAPTSPVRFGELPEPPLTGPRGIRVRNRLCGICASDIHLVLVDIDPMIHPAALPGFERIYLGHEAVGEVVEVGPETKRLRVGDRVLMQSRFLGGNCTTQAIAPRCRHCEEGNYAICESQSLKRGLPGVGGGWSDGYTGHDSEVWKVPSELTDEQAVLVEPLACGVRAVMRRPPAPREKVLVIGAGIIGLATVQAARAVEPKAQVWAAARHAQQKEAARKFGAEVLGGADLFAAAAEATGAKLYTGQFRNRTMLGGFDVVYDCVGNARTVGDSLRLARAGGTVVVVGVHLHRMLCDLTPVWHQEVNLLGTLAHGREVWKGEPIDTFDLTARFLREGKMRTDGLVTHRFPLSAWRQAVRAATDKRTGSIKVVLEI